MRKKTYQIQNQQKISELGLKRFHIEKKLKQLLMQYNMELCYLT